MSTSRRNFQLLNLEYTNELYYTNEEDYKDQKDYEEMEDYEVVFEGSSDGPI